MKTTTPKTRVNVAPYYVIAIYISKLGDKKNKLNKTMKNTNIFSLLLFVGLASVLLVMPSCHANDKGQKQKKQTSEKQETISIANINIKTIADDYDRYWDCENPDTISYMKDMERLDACFKQGNTWLAPNVETFLDSISLYTGISVHGYEQYGYNEDSLIAFVRSTAHELHRFQTGERRYYPEEEVKGALVVMGSYLGKWYNHTIIEDLYIELYYWYCFASQAALLCPNVEFICDYHSEDHQIGLWNEKCAWYYPMMSWLLAQQDNHCTIRLVDFHTHFDRIFQIQDDRGRDYYLITNAWGDGFGAFLYEHRGDELVLVASNPPFAEFGIIVYNPIEHKWDICDRGWDYHYPDHKYWVKIEGTQSLYLHLDEDVPFFEVH